MQRRSVSFNATSQVRQWRSSLAERMPAIAQPASGLAMDPRIVTVIESDEDWTRIVKAAHTTALVGKPAHDPPRAALRPRRSTPRAPATWPHHFPAGSSPFPRCASKTSRRAVVDAHATWTGPCRTLGQVLNALYYELIPEHDVRFVSAPNDEGVEALNHLCGTSRPTFILFIGGKEVGRVEGAIASTLVEEIRRLARKRDVLPLRGDPTTGP
jgi:hypothetical protein